MRIFFREIIFHPELWSGSFTDKLGIEISALHKEQQELYHVRQSCEDYLKSENGSLTQLEKYLLHVKNQFRKIMEKKESFLCE